MHFIAIVQRVKITVAIGVLVVGGCAGIAYSRYQQSVTQPAQPELVVLPVTESAATSTLARSEPVLLSIPTIGVTASFTAPLGLTTTQEIEVPKTFDEVGWYKNGATPGEVGPAVVLGHVDSYKGPAVLYRLGELVVGDEILITRADGSIALFVVTNMERFSQSAFPTELVYGDIDYPGLRLITCSGTYDRGIQRYSHNLVVFARLKE